MRINQRLRPLALAVGLLAVTACGSTAPTAAVPTDQGSSAGFSTQGYGGYGYGDGYGYGYGAPGYGGYGCNNFGTCGSPYANGFNNYAQPVAGDIYGGLTVWNGRRLDRQPASLPLGVAEENDEAFRPVGSAIWQKK